MQTVVRHPLFGYTSYYGGFVKARLLVSKICGRKHIARHHVVNSTLVIDCPHVRIPLILACTFKRVESMGVLGSKLVERVGFA